MSLHARPPVDAGRSADDARQPMVLPTLFTHAEAEALLPFVRDTFETVRPLASELDRAAARLGDSGVGPFELKVVGEGGLSPDTARRRARVHELVRRIDDELSELIALGIQVKGIDGLIDFPSRLDDAVVLLCWKWDEDGIGWWHDLESGYAGRQPVTDTSAFRGDDADVTRRPRSDGRSED